MKADGEDILCSGCGKANAPYFVYRGTEGHWCQECRPDALDLNPWPESDSPAWKLAHLAALLVPEEVKGSDLDDRLEVLREAVTDAAFLLGEANDKCSLGFDCEEGETAAEAEPAKEGEKE